MGSGGGAEIHTFLWAVHILAGGHIPAQGSKDLVGVRVDGIHPRRVDLGTGIEGASSHLRGGTKDEGGQ